MEAGMVPETDYNQGYKNLAKRLNTASRGLSSIRNCPFLKSIPSILYRHSGILNIDMNFPRGSMNI